MNTVHVTDLSGGRDVSIQAGSVNDGVQAWVTGDQAWYERQQTMSSRGLEIRQLFTVPVSGAGPARLVAKDVVAADVSDGRAAWVTTDAKVYVANADGTGVREVPVPLGAGCTLTPAPYLSFTQALAVARDAVAVTERCSEGARAFDELLAFDTSGRLLVHVEGLTVTAVSLSGSSLAMGGVYRSAPLGEPRLRPADRHARLLGRFKGQVDRRDAAGRRSLRALVRRGGRARGGVRRLARVVQTVGMDIVDPAINDYLLAHSEPADERAARPRRRDPARAGRPGRACRSPTTRGSC